MWASGKYTVIQMSAVWRFSGFCKRFLLKWLLWAFMGNSCSKVSSIFTAFEGNQDVEFLL